MKVYAILNNYQIGSYAGNVYSSMVISKERLDKGHTKVVWELENSSQLQVLQKVVGAKKLFEVED